MTISVEHLPRETYFDRFSNLDSDFRSDLEKKVVETAFIAFAAIARFCNDVKTNSEWVFFAIGITFIAALFPGMVYIFIYEGLGFTFTIPFLSIEAVHGVLEFMSVTFLIVGMAHYLFEKTSEIAEDLGNMMFQCLIIQYDTEELPDLQNLQKLMNRVKYFSFNLDDDSKKLYERLNLESEIKALDYLNVNLENKTEEQIRKEIKTSYYRLALQTHPDKNPSNPNAKEEFQKLEAHVKVLKTYYGMS